MKTAKFVTSGKHRDGMYLLDSLTNAGSIPVSTIIWRDCARQATVNEVRIGDALEWIDLEDVIENLRLEGNDWKVDIRTVSE